MSLALFVLGLLILVPSGLCTVALLGPQIVRDTVAAAGLSQFVFMAIYVWPFVLGAPLIGAALIWGAFEAKRRD